MSPRSAEPASGDLARLDQLLRPVRRVVRYAMSRGARARYLGALAGRQVREALALDLPGALRQELDEVAGVLAGFDEASEAERGERLSSLYAGLARLDAVAGLPLPPPRLRPVRKPVQRDEPEAAPRREAAPSSAEAASSPGKAEQPRRAPRELIDLHQELTTVVPDEVAAVLAEHGLVCIADVLQVAPAGFEDHAVHAAGREASDHLPELAEGGLLAVGGTLLGSWTVLGPRGGREVWSRLEGAAEQRVHWGSRIGEPWREVGSRVVVVGRPQADGTLVDAELAIAHGAAARLPRYDLDGVADRDLRAVVRLWAASGAKVRDVLSAERRTALGLVPRGDALLAVHQGEPAARRRMAFDEALLVQLAGFMRANEGRGLPHSIGHGFAAKAGQILELELNDAQQACFEDVKRDLRSPVPMRRVLTGEVGLGRGLVALRAAALVGEGRNQVLIVADDEVGAALRYLHSETVLRESGLVSKLVPAPPTGSQRDAIRRGEVQVVFGTAELLQHDLEFRRLGLVVAIERERWGHVSRSVSALSSPRPDLLVVPAVPVGPRLLFTAYADHTVTELADGERRPAEIHMFHSGQRAEAYGELRQLVEAGGQAVVVFPLVRGRDALDLREAVRVVRALEDELLEGLSVGLFHSAMPEDERRRVHDDFNHRRLQVLVSTTRLEEGPRIPGARLVVVEQADAVESWRLHRLIGFLSRSEGPSRAILVSGDHASRDSVVRLERLQQVPSGVALTELRVAAAGLGEAVAEGAAPLPSLSWLEPERDLDLVLAARAEAHAMWRDDPTLRRGPRADLLRELISRWGELWPDADERWSPPPLEAMGEARRRRRRRRRRK